MLKKFIILIGVLFGVAVLLSIFGYSRPVSRLEMIHTQGMNVIPFSLDKTLLKNDLVDELRLRTFPVTIGTGKRLFGEGTIPVEFKLMDSQALPSGVILANYKRDGELKTGSMA